MRTTKTTTPAEREDSLGLSRPLPSSQRSAGIDVFEDVMGIKKCGDGHELDDKNGASYYEERQPDTHLPWESRLGYDCLKCGAVIWHEWAMISR